MKKIFSIEPDGSVNYMGEDGKTSTSVNSENSERLFNEIKQHDRIRIILNEASDDLQKALMNGDEEAKEDAIRRLNLAEERKKEVEQEFKQIKSKVNETAQLSRQLDNGLLTPIASFFEVFLKTRDRLLALLPDDTMDVFKKNFIDSINKDQKEQIKLLESSGLQLCTNLSDLSDANPGFVVDKKEQDVLIVTFLDENGKSGCIVIDKPEQLETLSTTVEIKDKLSKCIEVDFFTVPYSVYQDNSILLSVAEDKKAFVAKIPGSVRHTQFSRMPISTTVEIKDKNTKSKTDTKTKSPDLKALNKRITEKMKPFYVKEKSKIDPRKVDWSAFIAQGINVEKLSDDDKRLLLSGKRTGLIETLKKEENGKISRTPCKVRIREDNGQYVPVVMAKADKLSIPDEFLGYKFSDEQKEQLLKQGVLSETIQVKVASKSVNIMPFVEPELNRLVFRDFDKLIIPDKIEGMEISTEAKKSLLSGKTTAINFITDGQKSSAYARINPMTGCLEAINSPFSTKLEIRNHIKM